MNARRLLVRAGAALRDGWLALGITLGLFLLLEGAYRFQAALRGNRLGLRRAEWSLPALHPYANQEWFREFVQSDQRTDRFDPYRGYWSKPFRSRYKNIDSLGRRVTIQPEHGPGTAREVFLLGGSTMFGFNSRDSLTIPSLVASRLAAQGEGNLEVVNLGQGGFTVMQEATTLLLELAKGKRPAAAVFMDGTNDIYATESFGEPGHHPAEARTQRFIELGSRNFGQELLGLGRHSQLVLRLQQMLRPPAAGRHAAPQRICGSLAGYYANLSRAVRAMSAEFQVPVLYFQQPMQGTTNKRLTAWERTIRSDSLIRPCAASIDSAMRPETGRTYFSLAGLFDADTASVFTDHVGHVTEQANRTIAARLAAELAPLLRPIGRRAP